MQPPSYDIYWKLLFVHLIRICFHRFLCLPTEIFTLKTPMNHQKKEVELFKQFFNVSKLITHYDIRGKFYEDSP